MNYDGTSTWMGLTLTHEFIYQMYAEGLNPWLTMMYGRAVPLAPDDPRNLTTRKSDDSV